MDFDDDVHDLRPLVDESDSVPGEVTEVVTWTARSDRMQLHTRIGPANANHSFNGLLFDVRAVGVEDVVVTGVVVGGEIGHYSVFFREGSWRQGYKHALGWTLVAQGVHDACWHGCELPLQQRVVRAGQTCALFVHSSENHDRGISYQSFSSYSEPIVSDGNLAVYPGQARIGTDAFEADDELNRWGWHRGPRGLAGAIVFGCVRKAWSVRDHRVFPRVFRGVIMTLLLCAQRPECLLAALPMELFLLVTSMLDWRDWPCTAQLPRLPSRTASLDRINHM